MQTEDKSDYIDGRPKWYEDPPGPKKKGQECEREEIESSAFPNAIQFAMLYTALELSTTLAGHNPAIASISGVKTDWLTWDYGASAMSFWSLAMFRAFPRRRRR